jgi:glutaredoxin-related protein
MKGTPETPQCGFSRATIQILGLQGVDPAKFSAFNVLEDEALRQGISYPSSLHRFVGWKGRRRREESKGLTKRE